MNEAPLPPAPTSSGWQHIAVPVALIVRRLAAATRMTDER